MRIKITDEQPGRSRAILHTSILLAIAFCVGIYLISTAVLIAKDGITFIEYARNLEVSPLKTIKSECQHPGYPFLIAVAHKIVKIVHDGSSLRSWIYSAQAVALIFRLLTVVSLYFAGKKIVGQRFSFWALLILILLPSPAKLGSDALSDWPHIFFLSTGFLLLIGGAVSRKWWLFGFSGLAAGMGYLIRPECAQVVVPGTLWLVMQVFWSQRTMSRHKAVLALALLLVGFLVTAGPYMKSTGSIFPKKQIGRFVLNIQSCETYEQEIQIYSSTVYTTGFVPSDIAVALVELVEKVGETLMWFFVLPLLIGIDKHLRKRNWHEPEKFFMAVLVVFNILLMIFLYCKYGYMSRRHTLPLVVFTIFYVPAGLRALASWFNEKLFKTMERLFAVKTNTGFGFLVLLVIGISICSPKLLRPIRIEKQGYRDAARWLVKNTSEKDIIAVPDIRIGFYSGRRGVEYDGQTISKEAQYVVKVLKNEKDRPTDEEMLQTKEVFSTTGDGRESKVIIYRIR
jgi:hypothetical protein